MTEPRSGWKLLRQTSRTFYEPVMGLPPGLREAVGSAYLCMRAIDQIEDHDNLRPSIKIELLEGVGHLMLGRRSCPEPGAFEAVFGPYAGDLEPVTLRLAHHAEMAPPETMKWVCEITGEMALSMAKWVGRRWQIVSEDDLDEYTFDVAGRVGVLLNELWRWHDGTEANRDRAIGFGRGLQAVNILRNRREDAERGVCFFPKSWGEAEMMGYIDKQLALARAYLGELPDGAPLSFCWTPFHLAEATVEAIAGGAEKLSRYQVMRIMARGVSRYQAVES